MSKVTDVVSWVMKDEKFLKLEKVNKTYDISDAVAKFLDGKGLLGDDLADKTVDVEIDESTATGEEGESSGTITMLKLSDGKAEPVKEDGRGEKPDTEKPNVSGDLVVKLSTIAGVSAKGGVKLKEDKETKTWYDLDSTIEIQKFKSECTGKEVEITVLPQEKGNDVIKGYVVKVEEKKEEKETGKETGSAKKTYKGTGNSIEAQAAMKAAYTIISSIVDKDSKADDVLSMITKIATHSYKLIQDLKNKE